MDGLRARPLNSKNRFGKGGGLLQCNWPSGAACRFRAYSRRFGNVKEWTDSKAIAAARQHALGQHLRDIVNAVAH